MAIPTIHKITHWKKATANEYGEVSFDDPVEVLAFWIDEEHLRTSKEGDDFVSMAKILSRDKLFNNGDRVQFAALVDSDKSESFVVRRIKFVENGRQTTRLHTALLGKD